MITRRNLFIGLVAAPAILRVMLRSARRDEATHVTLQRAAFPPSRLSRSRSWVFVIVFVILIAPIAVCVPAMFVFIPPPVIRRPAVLASFGQVVACPGCLWTSIPVALDGLVQVMIGLRDSAMAGFISISTQGRNPDENHKSSRCCRNECRLSERMFQTMW